ncbi:MAG: ABC transporter permease [Lapillicoccus sp.]
MRAALRQRRAQTLVVLVLSALVTTCLVFAPLYTRALEQAMVRTMLAEAPAQESGLRLESVSSTEPALAQQPDALAALVPGDIRGRFAAPVASTALDVRLMPLIGQPGGRLLARDGMCAHVRFTSGRCPTAPREVAVSTDQARAYAQPLGTSLEVGEFDAAVSTPEAAPRTSLTVVGVYEPVDGAYWFGDRLTGAAAQRLGYDTMLTPSATLTGPVTAPNGGPATWFGPRYGVDLPLLTESVGIDEIAPLGASVARLATYPMGVDNAGSRAAETVTVRSGLPAIAAAAAVGSAQAAVTVPLLMAQMGLLLGSVLWLVLLAAADQRRGEVAVARLRGRGARGARRLLLAETLPPVVVGAPLGAALALGGATVARHTVLAGEPPFEVPVSAVVALVLGMALMVGLAVLSVRRVCREPVAALIRSVPTRRSGVRLGVLEAMLVAAAVAVLVALVTGSVGGPVGQVAPALLALAVGVVAARVLASLLGVAGRRLLQRGRPTSATALLTASRRGTTRWLVPVVTVALSIVVVTTDALAVGARNWEGRAAAELGATSVLTVSSVDLPALAKAVQAVDPTGRRVTPVVVVGPASGGGATTVGVVPEGFRQVALWPGVDAATLPWDRLTAPTVPPLLVTGTRAAFHVTAPPFRVVQPAFRETPTALAFAIRVVHADGSVEDLPLGTLPASGVDADLTAAVTCADGCRVTGLGVLTPRSTAAVAGTLALTGLTVDGRAVDLGAASAWRDNTGDAPVTGTYAGGGAQVSYTTNGSDPALVTHASVPVTVPALTTPAAAPSAAGATFGGSFVDGSPLLLSSVGSVRFVPGGPAAASIVNLDNLLAQGWRGRGSATLSAYVSSSDPAYLAQVTNSFAQQGISVTATTRAADVAAGYGRSAAAWSLELALAVGILSLLVAAVGIVVLASTSSRARTRDYAAMRLAGLRPRRLGVVAQLETVPVILIAALLGAVVGLWVAPAALGLLPLFTTTPPTFPVDVRTAWTPALLAAVVGLAVLSTVGALASHRVARRADPQRLREVG